MDANKHVGDSEQGLATSETHKNSEDGWITVRQALATLPVRVSERRFRQAVRRQGMNYLDGRLMMVRTEDLDAIL